MSTTQRATLEDLRLKLIALRNSPDSSSKALRVELLEDDIKSLMDEIADDEGLPEDGPENPQEQNEDRAPDPSVDFDWTSLFAAMGEPTLEPKSVRDRHELAVALRAVFVWVADTKTVTFRTAGERILALIWSLNPEILKARKFKYRSLDTLAITLGVHKPRLSKLTAKASRDFGTRNQFKGHDWKNP